MSTNERAEVDAGAVAAAGCTVFFDEAECDVDCLAEDCEIAVRDARAALAKARGEASADEVTE